MEKMTLYFLEHLEAIKADQRRLLPAPFVMDRICELIGELKQRRGSPSRHAGAVAVNREQRGKTAEAQGTAPRRQRDEDVVPDDRAAAFRVAMDRVLQTPGPMAVDVQCMLSADRRPVLKEFAVRRGDSARAWCLVKSPAGQSPLLATPENDYLKVKHHGLSWEMGDITVEVTIHSLTLSLFLHFTHFFI